MKFRKKKLKNFQTLPLDTNGEPPILMKMIIDLPPKFEENVTNGHINAANHAILECIQETNQFITSQNLATGLKNI